MQQEVTRKWRLIIEAEQKCCEGDEAACRLFHPLVGNYDYPGVSEEIGARAEKTE